MKTPPSVGILVLLASSALGLAALACAQQSDTLFGDVVQMGGSMNIASGGATLTAAPGSGGGTTTPASGGSSPTATGGSSPTATGGSSPTATGGSSPTATGGSSPTATGGSSPTATGGSSPTATGGASGVTTTPFSFFVTSLVAMRQVSGSQLGFGGDLRFGETTGLAGADKICRAVAEMAMPGNGKTWRAFLSAVGPPAVNAIDRVGDGPWYDRVGRLVAMTKAALAMTRPTGADAAISNDLPNEFGAPNHNPDGTGQVDNHDTLTGSTTAGLVMGTSAGATCNDWTSAVGTTGKPMCGHSWPQNVSGTSWIQAHTAAGCAPGVNLVQTGGPTGSDVGSAGGYGGIYCLALQP